MLLPRHVEDTRTLPISPTKIPRSSSPTIRLALLVLSSALLGSLVGIGTIRVGVLVSVPLAVSLLLGASVGMIFSRNLQPFSRAQISIGLITAVLLAQLALSLVLQRDPVWKAWEEIVREEGLPIARSPQGIVRISAAWQEIFESFGVLFSFVAAFYVSGEDRARPRCLHCQHYHSIQSADCHAANADRLGTALAFGDSTSLVAFLSCPPKTGFARISLLSCSCEKSELQILVEQYRYTLLGTYRKRFCYRAPCQRWLYEEILGCLRDRRGARNKKSA
jgi:hypothetical protein